MLGGLCYTAVILMSLLCLKLHVITTCYCCPCLSAYLPLLYIAFVHHHSNHRGGTTAHRRFGQAIHAVEMGSVLRALRVLLEIPCGRIRNCLHSDGNAKINLRLYWSHVQRVQSLPARCSLRHHRSRHTGHVRNPGRAMDWPRPNALDWFLSTTRDTI